MWSRSAAAAGLLLLLTALGDAQNTGTYSRAVPPDPTALARLNLKTEWSLYLPIAGGRDQIQLVQTFDNQLFVQTRTGLLIAVDVRTGRVMWSAALGTGGYTNVYPVAANDRFVFASNVTRVFALYRDSGVVEFTLDLGTTPVAGLAADARSLYAAVGSVPGGAGENRVIAYDLPNPIVIPEAVKAKDVKAGEALLGVPNPVDQLTSRYPRPGRTGRRIRTRSSAALPRRAGRRRRAGAAAAPRPWRWYRGCRRRTFWRGSRPRRRSLWPRLSASRTGSTTTSAGTSSGPRRSGRSRRRSPPPSCSPTSGRGASARGSGGSTG